MNTLIQQVVNTDSNCYRFDTSTCQIPPVSDTDTDTVKVVRQHEICLVWSVNKFKDL